MALTPLVRLALACMLASSTAACTPKDMARMHAMHAAHGGAPPAGMNLQGQDAQSWIDDPHVHQFYDVTKATFAQGADKVDVAAYEQRSFAIFRAFGASRGMDPAAMQDHLKLIPRQLVQIAKDDPKALDTYESFVAATFGPQ